MKYLMFVCVDPTGEPGNPAVDMGIDEWVDMADSRGREFGDRLVEAADARTVRVRGDELLITDGPFTESREWIAGIDILECDSLEDALDIASKHPMARGGRIEVRAFWSD